VVVALYLATLFLFVLQPEPQLKIADVPLHLRSWDKYVMEILMVTGLAVYLVNFFIGKSRNSAIASAW